MVPWWTVVLTAFGAFSLGFMLAAILSAAGHDAASYDHWNTWDTNSTDTQWDMP